MEMGEEGIKRREGEEGKGQDREEKKRKDEIKKDKMWEEGREGKKRTKRLK